jgi:hypothetical protein
MIRIDTLPETDGLRRTPFKDLSEDGYTIWYKRGNGTARKLFPTFAIAYCTFNELGRCWTDGWEWSVEK